MEDLNITSARYIIDPHTNENMGILAVIDGSDVATGVPLDPANRHYAEIMRQVDEGTLTIQDAD